MEQELLTLPKDLKFTPGFSRILCCSIFIFLCSDLYIIICPFVLFLLAIVLSVLRNKDSDYPCGIFKFFLFSNNSYIFVGSQDDWQDDTDSDKWVSSSDESTESEVEEEEETLI